MSDRGKASVFIRHWIDRLGTLGALVGVWTLFAVLTRVLEGKNTFATWGNTQTFLLHAAVVGVAALGATIVIIAGGIDLSVGSLIGLVSVLVAYTLRALVGTVGGEPGQISPVVAGAIAAAVGVAAAGLCGVGIGAMIIGRVGSVAAIVLGGVVALAVWSHRPDLRWAALAGGFAVAAVAWFVDARLKLSRPLLPFIVTLGTLGAFRGAAKGLSNDSAIYPQSSWLNSLMLLPSQKPGETILFRPWHWWSPGVWVFLILAMLVAALLRYTQFGRHAYAIGSNEQTARLCGIHVGRTKLAIYTVAALLTGVAGVLQFSNLGMGDGMTGNGYELKVIASVVIGGASLSGGVGTVLGTVAGALLIMITDNGCTKVGLANWMQEILTGAIIVAAVALDRLRHRDGD